MLKRVLFVALLLFCIPELAIARDHVPFLTVEELPDFTYVLPAPPEFTSPQFQCDKIQYDWGKSVRETPRGEQAVVDAQAALHAVVNNFSAVMGIQITKKATPKIYNVIGRTVDTVMIAISAGKKHFGRPRPYIHFSEHSLIPAQEASHGSNASYPSGHSAIGWTTALVLAEINPKAQNEILKKGYEYGQSRVIAGYHFQSDVDASRLISSMIVNLLHTNEEFLTAMSEAKKEFDRVTSKKTPDASIKQSKRSNREKRDNIKRTGKRTAI